MKYNGMDALQELFEQYLVKHDREIKRICAPLKVHLNISLFIYFCVEEDGYFSFLSTFSEALSFYYAKELYLDNPFLVHPSLLSSGSILIPPTYDENLALCFRERFLLRELLLILKSSGNVVEGFVFASPVAKDATQDFFLQNIELLYKFIPYFKNEAQQLLRKVKENRYNIQEARGEKFWQADPAIPLSKNNPHTRQFLKELFPLSPRELECFELFKHGETAQSTAAILGLSQRTVEFYFENIKHKLNCKSKNELLQIP